MTAIAATLRTPGRVGRAAKLRPIVEPITAPEARPATAKVKVHQGDLPAIGMTIAAAGVAATSPITHPCLRVNSVGAFQKPRATMA
jgi:hypothetical protein